MNQTVMDAVEQDIRVALLSIDARDMDDLEAPLKNIFENMGLGIDRFSWGHQNPLAPELNDHGPYGPRDRTDWQSFWLRMPSQVSATVSLFIEVFLERLDKRGSQWSTERDDVNRKTFSLAFYEVVDGKVGRIKVVEKMNFVETGVGSAHIVSSVETEQGGGKRAQSGDYHGKRGRRGSPFGLPDGPLPRSESIRIVGAPKLVTESTRNDLQSRVDKAEKRRQEV